MLPREILDLSVRLTVGAAAEPRPGQAALCEQVCAALDARTHASAIAPTGSGKSYALLAAAAWRVVEFDERVLLSTESLSLQKQILEKDAPVVVRAVVELGGPEIRVAVLKGTSNYVDPRKLMATVAALTGLDDRRRPLSEWREKVRVVTTPGDLDLDGADLPMLRELVDWALAQYEDDEALGDRHSCPLSISESEWAHVSAEAAEAAGEDDHWLLPKAAVAKARAAEADIVIVNHTLLAIQTATGLPIINGNGTYGVFENILVDEAHALPDEVRAQGSATVSGRAIGSVIRAVEKVAAGTESWSRDGRAIGEHIDSVLSRLLAGRPSVTLTGDQNPLDGFEETIKSWLKRAPLKSAANSSDVRTSLLAKRAQARVDELAGAVNSVTTHRPGEARWVESVEGGGTVRRMVVSANSSPVNVSGKLSRNLWNLSIDDGSGVVETMPLGVACVSATLPQGFPWAAGLNATTVTYESPFVDAYAQSALYIPAAVSEADVKALTAPGWGGKMKFDTKAHTPWAARHIVALAKANRGSALVLAATSAAGKLYADALRAELRDVSVYSQWDGGTPASLLARWRDEHDSILVGTRSLMTGVDAPGETCSLVILDRIPRRPGNPIDDARVEEIVARGAYDKWSADQFVYVADAALLEAQAVGRLIRGVNDRGMAVVLDPRLLRYTGAFSFPSYPEPTRKAYMAPLLSFGVRYTALEEAAEYLRDRQRSLAAV